MREKGSRDRTPTRNDVYCTILGYLSEKPPRKCRLYLSAEKVEVLGQEETARKLRDEYGNGEVAFANSLIEEVLNAVGRENVTGQGERPPVDESDYQVYAE